MSTPGRDLLPLRERKGPFRRANGKVRGYALDVLTPHPPTLRPQPAASRGRSLRQSIHRIDCIRGPERAAARVTPSFSLWEKGE